MADKPKPCTEGKRHKWLFQRNRIIETYGPGYANISKRGVYRCACGEKKLGEPSLDN